MSDNQSEKVMELENDTLLELMKKYLAEQTPENLNTLILHLRECRILTPANLNEKKQATPVFIKNPNGEVFLPIYTDKEQLPEDAGAPVIVNVPYLEANAMVARDDILATGIVINPFTTNLVFKNALILRIEEVEKKRKENQAPQTRTVQMTEEQYVLFERKQFEAVFLPKKLYAEKEAFVEELLSRKETFVDQLFEESYQNKRLYPYLEEEFAVTALTIEDGFQVVRLDLPKRDCPVGACERVYFAWNQKSQEGSYFMAEKTNQDGTFKLVEITSDWQRKEYTETVEGSEIQLIMEELKKRA